MSSAVLITINGATAVIPSNSVGPQGPPGPAVVPGTAGQFYVTNSTATAPEWKTISGGQIGASAVTTGALSLLQNGAATGNTYSWNGSAWVPAALNLGGGSNYVSGNLPLANLALGAAAQIPVMNAGATAPVWVSLSGDVTITAAGVATVASSAKGITQLTGEVTAGPGSGSQASVVAGGFSTASLNWLKTVTAPLLGQSAQTTDTACFDLTIQPQFAFATATGANRAPGNFIINVGAPTNSGTTYAKVKIQQNGTAVGAIGNDSGVAGAGFWLGSTAPSGTNWVCESDGSSFTYYNTPSNLGFLASGSTFLMYLTGSNTMYLGGSSASAPIDLEWSTSTTPTIRSGTSATQLSVGTNKSGASLVLQQDTAITAWTLSGGNVLAMTAPATATSVAITQAAASGAPANMAVTAQAAGGTNDGGNLVLSGGAHSGSSKADGSVKVTTPFNPGFVSKAAASPLNLTNVESNANVLILTGAIGGPFTVNVVREIADTSLYIVRNNTGVTATIAYLSGGTVTVGTATSAVICSDGANLQKIMAGT